jgi:hypothetical protein
MKTAILKFWVAGFFLNLVWLILSLCIYPLHNALILGLIFIPAMTLLAAFSVIVPFLGQIVYVWFVYKIFLDFFFGIFPEMVSVDRWYIHLVTIYCVIMSLVTLIFSYRASYSFYQNLHSGYSPDYYN